MKMEWSETRRRWDAIEEMEREGDFVIGGGLKNAFPLPIHPPVGVIKGDPLDTCSPMMP
jgi:hypothetical protein